MKIIAFAVTNDISTDSRVQRISDTLYKQGYQIMIIGRKRKNSLKIEGNHIYKRFNLIFNTSALFYAEYNIRLFFYLLYKKIDIIVSNDLDTLLACFLASKLKNKELLYDSHEYFTEVPELMNRKLAKKAWSIIEKMILPRVKYSYTVCQSIADIYNKKYGIDMQVIRNIASYKNPINEKQNKNDKIIIYQGSVNIGRGLELAIDTVSEMQNIQLWIVGNGDKVNELKKKIQKQKAGNKIRFIKRVPYNKLHKITCLADIGISLEENMGDNYKYALPNKIFDYIQARIPILVSNLPEMKKIIMDNKIGLVLPQHNKEILKLYLRKIIDDKEKKTIWKKYLNITAKKLCWENEEKKIINLYNKILK